MANVKITVHLCQRIHRVYFFERHKTSFIVISTRNTNLSGTLKSILMVTCLLFAYLYALDRTIVYLITPDLLTLL